VTDIGVGVAVARSGVTVGWAGVAVGVAVAETLAGVVIDGVAAPEPQATITITVFKVSAMRTAPPFRECVRVMDAASRAVFEWWRRR
jgi:hypothetical protein